MSAHYLFSFKLCTTTNFIIIIISKIRVKRPLIKFKAYPDTMVLEVDGVKLETAPWDPRFPNTNQTKYCYQSFLDYQRCKKIRGEEFDACQYYKRVSKSICPNAWIDKWNTQIEENRFPGNI